MITVNIRKQGGAAVITIPSDVLKILNIEIGSVLELDVSRNGFTAKPVNSSESKRYSLVELLQGVTKEEMKELNEQTKWAHEGKSTGRELT